MSHKQYPLTVVIPSYKNEQMLVENLKHNLPYLEGCEVIVVNDYPPTKLQPLLADMPTVFVIERLKNGGFGSAVNTGVSHGTRPYVMLLNSDVILQDTTYRMALAQFEKEENLFGVSFAQTEQDSSTVGKNHIFWSRGMVNHEKAPDLMEGLTGWAEGGSCILRKSIYDQLGGFDLIYSPFYWEDVDLSYRAKKAGYSVLFNPHIVVEHHHETTTGMFDKRFVQTVALRNQILFVWRNITDHDLQLSHIGALSSLLLKSLFRGEFWVLRAWAWALQKYLTVSPTTRYNAKSDKEVLAT